MFLEYGNCILKGEELTVSATEIVSLRSLRRVATSWTIRRSSSGGKFGGDIVRFDKVSGEFRSVLYDYLDNVTGSRKECFLGYKKLLIQLRVYVLPCYGVKTDE
jgi:hypothetical protein